MEAQDSGNGKGREAPAVECWCVVDEIGRAEEYMKSGEYDRETSYSYFLFARNMKDSDTLSEWNKARLNRYLEWAKEDKDLVAHFAMIKVHLCKTCKKSFTSYSEDEDTCYGCQRAGKSWLKS